ncbi:MAG TPA: VTT domain-containing protein [Polyangiales bacterium]
MAHLPEKPDVLARRARPLLIGLGCFAIGGVLLSQGLDAGSPARDLLRGLLEQVRDPYWGILYVLGAYALGTLVFAPITAMFIATCLAVGALRGVVYSLLGGLFSASLAYLVGRRLGAGWVRRLEHRSLDRLRGLVASHPVRATLVARFLPVGNFTLINLALGGFRVRYWAFLLGNVLGIMPGLLAITVFKGLLEEALSAPDWQHWAIAAAGGVAAVAMLYAVARRLTQRRALRVDGEDEAQDEVPQEPEQT